MIKQKQLVPKRRFEEFKGDWQMQKLEKIAEIVRGASPRPIQDPKWFDKNSDVGWLRISDVTEQNGKIEFLEQRLSKLGEEKTRVLYEPHLLLSIAATVGKPLINYVKTGVHDGFLIFKKPKFDLQYMSQWLEMFRPDWNKYGQPGSQVNLNSEIVKNQMVILPNSKEQQKIGEFFKHLDEMIALEQRKIDKTLSLKSAYLAEMFPAEGERVPKRRFAGFNGEWKKIRIGDLYNSIEGGNRLPKTMLVEGSIPYVIAKTTDNGILMRIDNKSNDYHGNKMKKFPSGSITLSIDNPEAIFLQKEPFYTSNIMRVLYMEEYNNNQSMFILESLKRLTENYNWSLKFSGPVVMDSLISMPVSNNGKVNWIEVDKIGQLINTLNDLSTLHQQKLEKLKATKQAYLHEMFV